MPTLIMTKSGREIQVRFLEPEDGPLLVDLVQRLSPESRYRRFHISAEHLPADVLLSELPKFMDVDGVNHVALLAIVSEEGQETAIGVARFKRQSDPQEAEAAVVVRDDWQQQGIGSALMAQLVEVAREVGVRRFSAWVQASNRPVMRMLRALDLPVTHQSSQGEDLVHIFLDGTTGVEAMTSVNGHEV